MAASAKSVANATITIHSLRPPLAEIERCLDWFLADAGIQGHVTPTIQSGGQKARKRNGIQCNGWVSQGYQEKDTALQPLWSTREGQSLIELTLVAEHMNRSTLDILHTVCHEAVHLVAIHQGIKDCAASGRHNLKFKALAENMGLEVIGLDAAGKPTIKSVGYGVTKLGAALQHRLETEFLPNDAAFDVFRNLLNKAKKPSPPKFECPNCHEFVRGHAASNDRPATNIICGDCMVPMPQVDDIE